jgi:hypothetical protein
MGLKEPHLNHHNELIEHMRTLHSNRRYSKDRAWSSKVTPKFERDADGEHE